MLFFFLIPVPHLVNLQAKMLIKSSLNHDLDSFAVAVCECLHTQDPMLSHLVDRYWYYHPVGEHKISGLGAGQENQENGQHDHGTINDPQFVNVERNLGRHANTYKLNKPDVIPHVIPDASLNQTVLSSPSPKIVTFIERLSL